VVDMRDGALTSRLREVAHLLAERGFVDKGIDMSPATVTYRLKTMSALSSMCLRLQRARIIPSAR